MALSLASPPKLREVQMLFFRSALIALSFASAANAQPTSGQVVNLAAKEEVTYKCRAFDDNAVGCTFTMYKVVEKSEQACTVTINEWTSNFTLTTNDTWVHDGESDLFKPLFPEKSNDTCGAVHLDRFEYDPETPRFNLVRRAIPSNPNGTVSTAGATCSDVYTGAETLYHWKDQPIEADCATVNFGITLEREP